MIEVNLLPEQQRGRSAKRRTKSSRKRGTSGGSTPRDPWSTALIAAGLAVVVGVSFMWWTQRQQTSELDARLDQATADSARLADLRAVSDSLTERQQLVRERVALVEQLDRGRFVWPHLMDEVSRALPRLAWLTKLERAGGAGGEQFRIEGTAANPLAITEFVRSLEASAYVTDVRILQSQQQELGEGDLVAQGFTLTARYAEPPGAQRTPIFSSTGF